jgi:hypothetical protein
VTDETRKKLLEQIAKIWAEMNRRARAGRPEGLAAVVSEKRGEYTSEEMASIVRETDEILRGMITKARAGQTGQLGLFVRAARRGGSTYRETFEAFQRTMPELERREFDALVGVDEEWNREKL